MAAGKVLGLCLRGGENSPPGDRAEDFREEIGKEYERCQHCGALRRGRMFCRRDRLSGEKPRQGVFGLFGVSGRVRGVRPRGFCPKKQSPGKTLREECGRFGIGGAGSRPGGRAGNRLGGGKSRGRRKGAGRPEKGKGRSGRTRQTLKPPETFTNLTRRRSANVFESAANG